MSIILTFHAIDRFRARVASHLTHDEAKDVLYKSRDSAELLPQKSLLGHDQYLIDRPYRVVLVCKNDPFVGCVAVTAVHERWQGPTSEDLAELDAAVRRANGPTGAQVGPKPTIDGRAAKGKASQEANIARQREISKAAKEAARKEREENSAEKSAIDSKVRLLQRTEDFERKTAKLLAHVDHTERDFKRAKNVLRGVLRVLVGHCGTSEDVAKALLFVEESEPGFLADGFLATVDRNQ